MGGKSDLVKGALDLTAKLLGKGEEAINSFQLPKIKPTSENVHDVGAANFDYYDVVGNKKLPIKDVFGGVDLAQPDQRARVDALKSALSNPEKGYISRLIVDDEGNVIEGQHRLDALRELGASEVPVTMLRDKSRGIDISAIKNAIQSQGGIHPDQTKQIIDMILEGDPNDYEPPQGFEKWWNIGVNEYNKQRGIKREGYSGKGRVVGDVVDQALNLIMGAGKEAAPKAIRAYHVSPHDFDVFKPSEFRGSTFFSSTPERARRGAEAGRNEMVMETSTELPPVNWRTYEVEIDPSRIKGLSLTPSENKWFEALPGKIVGDDALKEATKGIPQGMYWDDFYDETPISEGVYEYTKKSSPPSMSYEEAINKNRDIYRQQWPHYAGTATDEKSSASRLNDQGMGGYLLQDEGGLSFAINDPNSVRIIKKYADGGSIREGYAGNGRVVGDIVDQALKLITGEGGEEAAKTGIRAYHGSPHDFDKFDMSKIGTGEGAQAYGHGLYFAEHEPIARNYRQALAGVPTVQYKGDDYALSLILKDLKKWQTENPETGSYLEWMRKKTMEDAAKILLENVGGGSDAPGVLRNLVNSFPSAAQDTAKEWIDQTENLIKPHLAVNEPGHMYEVNIAADPNTFLDWDKPLSEQPEAVRRALEANLPEYKTRNIAGVPHVFANNRMIEVNDPSLTGRDAYILSRMGQPGDLTREQAASASSALREAGIPGIKYLDAGSRSAGEGTRNYVVFDDKLISIIRKYGIAGASAMLGYNLMENLDPKQAQAATVADKEYQANQPEIRGGRLPAGMEPSGEMTSRTPSASDRIYDYVMSVLGGDEGTKAQRAQTVMNIIDQTPLAVGPVAYDVGRSVTEAVMRADGGAVREGYSGKGRVVGDIVDQALKLIMGEGEKVAPKVIGTDAAGRPMLDFRGAVVSHFTDPESAADIWSQGYRQVGDGYYGRAVSFTPNREYGRQFGGVETNAVVDPNANILNSGDPTHSEIIQRVLNDRSLAPTNPRPGQKTWDQRFRELGYDGLYDPGAGDLFIYNPSKVKPIVPKKAEGGAVDPYAEEIASAKRILADKAYKEQSWSDWAGDAAENAVRTARSILPTALGGEGSVGISDIARGAYEGGKDAVMFPGDVITGKQALFDEAGRPLESAIGRSFNTAATVGGASSVVPRPANSVGVFGGIKSLTADKNALTKAQIMESRGASPDDIWNQTGWGRGTDGQWRYEIPDIGTKVDPSKFQPNMSSLSLHSEAALGDYLEHPKLIAAYPEFAKMKVTEFGKNDALRGYYMPRSLIGRVNDPWIGINTEKLNTPGLQRNTMLHEVQHAIQQKEGFSPGSNPGNYLPDTIINPRRKVYDDAIKNDPELQEFTFILESPEYKAEIDKSNALFDDEIMPRIKEIQEIEKWTGADLYDEISAILDAHRKNSRNLFPLISRLDDLGGSLRARDIPTQPPREFLTPEEAYFYAAGEVEARNVQSRKDMVPTGLRAIPPWKTQEYPNDIQLIDWNNTSWRKGYADGGEIDDDITDALRIAKQVGGVLMEDAKGNKYDAQGNLIPPTTPGPNPARTPTPQEVGQKASMDPATFDALMEQYAVPDRDIAQYEATKAAVAAQPREIQQMTHVGDRPTREVKVDMPLFGGEYSVGSAPYDVAGNMSGVAQAAYDFKTAPFYAIPFTAPIAAGMDLAEGIATNDPLTASLAVGFGPGGKYAKAAGIGVINYAMDPAEAEAGPARWFSKAMEAAQAIPMEKMTGQQALAMLKKSVSPEELRWTGTDVFLSTTPKISKEELLDYLKNNRFQTEDVTLGGNKPTKREDVRPTETARAPFMEDWNILKEKRKALDEEYYSLSPDEQAARQDEFWSRQYQLDNARDALKSKMVDATIAEMGGLGLPVQYGPGSRYGDAYVTRGGEGYSEDLYKMPNAMKAYNLYVKQLREKYGEGALGDMPLTVSERGTLDNLMEAGGDERKVYTSGHFPQYPGYLAHSRSQILNIETPGANRPYKAWNVEEAQSDLAKSGRKSGFYDPVVYQKWANEYYANEKAIEKARDYLTEVSNRVSEAIGPEPKAWRDPAWNEYHIRRQDALDASPEVKSAREALNNLVARGAELDAAMPNTAASPIGPFVKSMEGWSKLTIKKQLDKAFDSGADYFTWTPGEAQAQRYSLSKVADRITYNPPFVSASGKQYAGRIVAIKNGSAVFEKNGVTPDKLPEFIGEELASKLLKNKEVIESGKFEGLERYSISGDEMKFGGEGMRKYYDSAFVKYVQDVFKEATGEKPKIEIVTAQTPDGPRQQLGVRLTEEMRDKARFSDFNKGGRVTDRAKYADSDTVSRALALTSEV